MLAHDCGVWRSFPAGGGGPVDVGVSGDPWGCGRLLPDAAGGLVHRVGDAGVDTFSMDGDGALRFEGTVPVWGMRGAVVGEPGRVYAAGDDGLVAIGRDRRTGRFVATRTGVALAGVPVAFDAEGERVLAAGSAGMRWFALGRDAAPAQPAAPDAARNGLDGCAFAVLRAGPTVDAFCPGVALSSRRGGEAYVGATLEGEPVGAVASPDGQHVYASTRAGEILTFARVAASASDDHGDGRSTATEVAIPSTTAGEIGVSGEADFFRVEVGIPGTLTFETTGTTNTYAFLYADTDRPLRFNDDGGEGGNFRIATGVGRYPELSAGVYHVGVWGYTTGGYDFVVSGTARGAGALAAASAPSVSVNAVAAGDEGTAATLGATLTGGTYDGAPEYDWDVSGGALDDDTSATPEWTRPSVSADTNFTVSLTVTVRGTGTNARDGTSDTASASVAAPVRDVPQLPVADAPSVSIHAVPDGDEGTATTLGATLTGGTYDGALEYAWTVSGGRLDNAASATPAWTRPSVSVDTSYTVELTVTARGTGTDARDGTSDTASASVAALVRDTAVTLPVASAPSVAIDAVADGDEGTKATLGATLSGGTYDGSPEYDWDVSGGALDDDTSATPEWTRPSVTSNANFTVSLTVTVNGAGTSAQAGTSATANASRAALVLAVTSPASCVDDAKWKTVADYYDHNATRSPNYGANWYRVLIAYRLEDPERTLPAWEGSTVQPTARYTAAEATTGETVWSGWTPVREVLECLERAFPTLPAAAAPTVAIDAVAAGDEGTKATLGATLAGGTYDGAVEYAWSVSGGVLDDATLATPEWTRPTVSADGDYTVGLTVTVHGAGTSARNGTSATANASLDAQVRNVAAQLPAAAAPTVTIDAVAAGDEDTPVTLGATLNGGTYDGSAEYAWTVTGGDLSDNTSATPVWTRPTVNADTNHTVRLAVTVHGAGTNAQNGSSATANASLDTQVRNVAVQLPLAAAPTVAINAIAAGDANTPVTLGATLTGGTYDGPAEYAWSVTGGALNDNTSATPTWTRPAVNADGDYTVGLEVTVHGAGTSARNGTSDTAKASRDAEVRGSGDHGDDRASATPIAIPSTTAGNLTRGDRDYFRIDIATAGTLTTATTGSTDTYGTLFDGDGGRLRFNDDDGQRYNFRIRAGTLGAGTYYLEVRGFSASKTGDYTLSVTGTARGPGTPAAAAPAVTINAVAAGDEGTPVTLGATLTGGTYDGTPEYAWGVSGGDLSDNTSATPTWRRPTVAADTNHTVSLALTVHGTGANAQNGSSATANASLDTQVRNATPQLPAAAAPSVSIDAIADGDEGTAVRLSAAVTGGTYDGALEYAWQVDGGALNDPASATPTWTRPSVNQNTNVNVELRVTVRGKGVKARNGTSDTSTPHVVGSLVRDVHPAPVAPSVSIKGFPSIPEGTDVQLSATLTGGSHSGTLTYAWSVDGGKLDDPSLATPTWTLPSATTYLVIAVALRVTVTDAGGTDSKTDSRLAYVLNTENPQHDNTPAQANAVAFPASVTGHLSRRDLDYFEFSLPSEKRVAILTLGTTDTLGKLLDGDGGQIAEGHSGGRPRHNFKIVRTLAAGDYFVEVSKYQHPTVTGDYELVLKEDTGNAPPPACVSDERWIAVADHYRSSSGVAPNYGANWYRVLIAYQAERADWPLPEWTGTTDRPTTPYTASEATANEAQSSNWTPVRQMLECLEDGPLAAAPRVSINRIAAGVEGTTVGLSARLTDGVYDMIEYAWQVDGGALDDATSATPEWTRPSLTSDTSYTVSLTVTVHGTGTDARNGTSDTANDSQSVLVRETIRPVADAPNVRVNAIPAGDEGTTQVVYSHVTGGTYDGYAGYHWTVSGGALDDPTLPRPRWTRPSVNADTDHTVQLTVTVHGTGANARKGTSDSATASVTARVNAIPPPVASAPAVTINAIPAGDEGTTVGLGASLAGGTYDDTPEYAWTVTGGALDDAASATPTWTRPVVGADTSYTVQLRVTARGTGANARDGTSDAATASSTALVRNAALPLPPPSAPSVSIKVISDGDEGTAAPLSATLTGGSYDGTPEYAWTVSGGRLDAPASATPTWTRPSVASHTSHTVGLTVTVRGADTRARAGSSATANANRSALVRDSNTPAPRTTCVDDARWERIADYYDHNANSSPGYGANWYRVLIAYRGEDPERTLPDWEGSTAQPTTPYTADEATANESEWSGWTPVREVLECLEEMSTALPVAAAPTLTINRIPAGNENVGQQLGAWPVGGTYDGSLEYAWEVDGGWLDDPASATPTWTRPTVKADGDIGIRVAVTVRGAGVNASVGSSDTVGTAHLATVRDTDDDHGNEPGSATAVAIPSTTAGNLRGSAGDGSGDTDYFRIDVGKAGTLTLASTGSLDTRGRLYDSDGTALYSNAYNGDQDNFGITTGTLAPGVYYLAVYGIYSFTKGDYNLVVSGSARRDGTLPAADTPTVAIDAIAAGNEGTDVGLSATLTGGTYDGALEYDWEVTGGTLDDPSSATPTWTRPMVNADASHTVLLRVTARGAGANAWNGSIDWTDVSRSADVRESFDHGHDLASATRVTNPSITTGSLHLRDVDLFRIDVVQAGTLTLETASSMDTFVELLAADGIVIRRRHDGVGIPRNDDGGNGDNFRLTTGRLVAGTYYVEVKAVWTNHADGCAPKLPDSGPLCGPYTLIVSGSAHASTPTSTAVAPTETIDAVVLGTTR